jgi:hypothetical protein
MFQSPASPQLLLPFPFLHLSHRLSLSLSISSFLAQLGEDEITGVGSPSILITLWLVPLDPINSLHRHLA